jgi:Fe-S cluster assembly protein SufD
VSSLLVEADAFRSGLDRLAAAPPFVEAMRRSALERFTTLGFPSTRQEAWKYTSVAPITKTSFSTQPGGGPPGLNDVGLSFLDSPTVFVDGHKEGAGEVSSLAPALREGRFEGLLGRLAPWREDAFAALNTAFLEDGALIEVEKGARSTKPIVLVHLTSGGRISHPRTLIVAGAQSQCSIIEVYAGRPGEVYFANAVTEVFLGDGAVLDITRVQWQSEAAFQVERVYCAQERSSQLTCQNFALGGSLFRSDIAVNFDGPGAECELNGLFVPRGAQHMDTATRIVHAWPHCTSRELFKGILFGRARGVFSGTVIVEKDAQKTDASQTNRNLLLSPDALVTSVPRLEILADDVKCKHGSATGQLNMDALFYLRSRGIDGKEAKGLLVGAFGRDLIQKVSNHPLRRTLEAELGSRLAQDAEAQS